MIPACAPAAAPDTEVKRAAELSPKESFLLHRFQHLSDFEQASVLAASHQALEGNSDTAQFDQLRREFLTRPKEERALVFERCLRNSPEIHSLLANEIGKAMADYHPALLLGMLHHMRGGTIGVLTARENRDGHEVLISELETFLGFKIPLETVYFVNDRSRNHRLRIWSSTAEKKLQILLDFLNGAKFDEHGFLKPKPRFQTVLFCDDEDKNLDVVRIYQARTLLSQVLRRQGLQHLSDRTLDQHVQSLFLEAQTQAPDRESAWYSVLQELSAKVPNNILKEIQAIDARKLSASQLWHELLEGFNMPAGSPLPCQNSLLMLDVDGTLVAIDAHIYVRDKTRPAEQPPLLIITQEQFSQNSSPDFWKSQAHKLFPSVALENMVFDLDDFSDTQRVERIVQQARHEHRIFKRRRVTLPQTIQGELL